MVIMKFQMCRCFDLHLHTYSYMSADMKLFFCVEMFTYICAPASLYNSEYINLQMCRCVDVDVHLDDDDDDKNDD